MKKKEEKKNSWRWGKKDWNEIIGKLIRNELVDADGGYDYPNRCCLVCVCIQPIARATSSWFIGQTLIFMAFVPPSPPPSPTRLRCRRCRRPKTIWLKTRNKFATETSSGKLLLPPLPLLLLLLLLLLVDELHHVENNTKCFIENKTAGPPASPILHTHTQLAKWNAFLFLLKRTVSSFVWQTLSSEFFFSSRFFLCHRRCPIQGLYCGNHLHGVSACARELLHFIIRF